jgi:hypothetical protein
VLVKVLGIRKVALLRLWIEGHRLLKEACTSSQAPLMLAAKSEQPSHTA